MIGKIKKGKSFAGLTKYILEKEKAELLSTNLAGTTPQDFYRQLGVTRQLNPRVQFPVSHISISFASGERPQRERLQQIVEGTLAGMGFDKNLYFAAIHNDRNHFHLHIAASRIHRDGECVSDWYDKRRLEKTLRNLEQQFDLAPVPCSWEVSRSAPSTGQKRRMMREQQEFERGLRDGPPDKSMVEKIQDAIDATVQPGMTITQFLNELDTAGVEAKVKVTGEGIVQGISYSIDGVAFPGGKLGRNDQSCTLSGLQRRGVTFDLGRDAEAIATHADSNSQRGDSNPAASLIPLMQCHPKNLSLTLSASTIEALGCGGEVTNMEQKATVTVADNKEDVLVKPPDSAIVPSIEPIQWQLAEVILPYAKRAFNYSLQHLSHQVSQEDNLTKVEGQDYTIVCQQVGDDIIRSVIALDEREEILRTRNGDLEMVVSLTDADLKKWQAIGAKIERLEKQGQSDRKKGLGDEGLQK